ncbi:hypothetical protein [Campylobacter sp. US33a]|uniref:hypothetical protein n=1 Tax=Campylobacter sp. US33a TaxID=2498120 RepID=UPI001067AAD5|nr:hypothetical protein [Campylobacter sp. US33a]TEY01251.1 hypothetical protein ELQ16_07785 [Campylobacter sp. US33a]
MNAILSILAIIYIFLLCNYLYRKIKGTPNKPLKEIWNEYKQEMQKINEEHKQKIQKIDEAHKQRMQKINENFEKEKERKKDLEKIENSYKEIYEEYKSLPMDKQGAFLHNLFLNNQDECAEAIRYVQIIEESVNIILKSKNKDTAESRRELVLEIEQKIREKYPKAYGLIINTIQLLKDNYDVNLFENQCIKYYEEAGKLKTIKSKQKRIDCINDLIKEAEANPKIDRKFVDFWKNKVKEII